MPTIVCWLCGCGVLDVMIEGRAGEWHYAVRFLLLDISDRGNQDKVSVFTANICPATSGLASDKDSCDTLAAIIHIASKVFSIAAMTALLVVC